MLAADWQNPVDSLDVDASDGPVSVSPIDALLVINELNWSQVSDPTTRVLPDLEDGMEPPPYVDVDGDNIVSPLDALLVINAIGQGEFVEPHNPQAADSVIAGTAAALSEGTVHDTLVNTMTSRPQSNVRMDANPETLVTVWNSAGQDGSSWGIYGQRYDAFGAKVGGEFAVNSTTKGSQRNPAVAVADDGSFVVAWQSVGQDGGGWGIYARSFDSNGNPLGGEFRVNQTTRGAQINPSIDFLGASDQFVVAWEGRGEPDKNGIHARLFSLASGGRTDELRVNSTIGGDQSEPDVVGTPDGGFAVVWEGKVGNDGRSIGFRSFDADAIPASFEVRVNQQTRGSSQQPAIALLESGDFVVAWQQRPDAVGSDVRSRRIGFNGSLVGSESRVNQTVVSIQQGPDIAALGDGYAVTWYGRGADDNRGVFARRFDDPELGTSNEFLVNHTTDSIQSRPSLASMNDGFVAAWQGNGVGDRDGVYARFFNSEPSEPPQLFMIADQAIDEGTTLELFVSATDPDTPISELRFALDAGPEGATLDSSSGQFRYPTFEADGPSTTSVTVRVFDVNDPELFDTESFMITVNEVNAAPTIVAVPNSTIDEFATLSLTFMGSDTDIPANTLTYAMGPLPDNATFNAATREFSFTPDESQGGQEFSFTATVTDNGTPSLSASTTFNVTVTELNGAPMIEEISDFTIDELTLLTFTPVATDPDDDMLIFSLSESPTEATIDSTTGEISWMPTEAEGPGAFEFTVVASDGNLVLPLTASQSFTVNVVEVNALPIIEAIPDQSIEEFQTLILTVMASDTDLPANTLTFALTEGPDGATIDPATGEFSWTPDESHGGQVLNVTVSVTDDADDALTNFASFSITVSELNFPPEIGVIPNATIDEFDTFTATATATDDDVPFDTLTYALDQAPLGATINSTTGEIRWETGEDDGPSVAEFFVRVTDNGMPAASSTTSFTVTVNEINVAPTLAAITNQVVNEQESLELSIIASDSDLPANLLTYALVDPPANATLDSLGNFTFMPSEDQGGMTFTIQVVVTDDGTPTLANSTTFDVTVNEVDNPPQITNLRLLVDTGISNGDNISTNPTIVADVSDDVMIATLTGRFVGGGGGAVDITDAAGDLNLNGTFTVDADLLALIADSAGPLEEGPYEFEFVVTDDLGQASNATIELVYLTENQPPILVDILDQTATEDLPFTLDIAAVTSDEDVGDTLVFSAGRLDGTPLPAWLTITDAGVLSGQPNESDAGTFGIRVSVSDSQGLTATDTFEVTVVAINDAPVIGELADLTIDVQKPFMLDIAGIISDEEGDPILIEVTGLPAWASYDGVSGIISGTPELADIGTSTVMVAATDVAGTSTATFGLTVEQINDPPFVSFPIPTRTPAVGEFFSIDLDDFFMDPDVGDQLSYSIGTADGSPLPSYLSLDSATNVLGGTPMSEQTSVIQVTATDLSGDSAFDNFVIKVGTSNSAPIVLTLPPQLSIANEPFEFDLSPFIVDPDPGDTLLVTAIRPGSEPLPDWLVFDEAALRLSGTPGLADVGTLTVLIVARDDTASSSTKALTIEVVRSNSPVQVSGPIPDQFIDQNAMGTFEIASAFVDDDVTDVLTYALEPTAGGGLPGWISVGAFTGQVAATPGVTDVGTLRLRATATDGESSASTEFTIRVNDLPDSPFVVRAIPDQLAEEDVPFILGAGGFFRDPDIADTLVFSADVAGNPLPAWLSLDATSGVLRGTPTSVDGGIQSITVVATDSTGRSASDTFELNVDANLAPSIDDQSFATSNVARAGARLGTVAATDLNPGDTLIYAIEPGPGSGRFAVDATTGELTITDSSGLVLGQMPTVDVTVTDLGGLMDTATMTISVVQPLGEFRFMLEDVAGMPISEVTVGDTFQLVVGLADLQAIPTGISSAYLDVTYDPILASTNGTPTFDPDFTVAAIFDLSTPGVMDEVGAMRTEGNPAPVTMSELFRIDMMASAAGTLSLGSDAADDGDLHPIFLTGGSFPIPEALWTFPTATLTIVEPVVLEAPSRGALLSTEFYEGNPLADPFEVGTRDAAGAGSSVTTGGFTLPNSPRELIVARTRRAAVHHRLVDAVFGTRGDDWIDLRFR